MQNYVIITDSTGDLSEALVKEMDVTVLPMSFSIGEKSYKNYPDNHELSAEDFYAMLRAGAMSTTAQLNTAAYLDAATPFLEAGQDVLFLVFSSGLSGSYNSSRMAVEDLRVRGISPVYLLTDHTGFYERYGWAFFCMAQCTDASICSRIYIHR